MNIQTKLALLLLALSFGVIAAAGIFSIVTMDEYFHDRIIEQLKTQANAIEFVVSTSAAFDSSAYQRLQNLAHAANLRLTLIRKDGTVFFESELPQNQSGNVSNHLDRPEVQQALREGFGTDRRKSATLEIEMLYLAKKLPAPFRGAGGLGDVSILRVGIPVTQEYLVMSEIRTKIILSSGGVLLLVVLFTLIVSRKLAAPIREMERIAAEIRSGNLGVRIPIRSKDELGKLGETLNGMIQKLDEDIVRLKKLERVRSEFLGNVSHELRTPIFAVQGMLETLLQGAIDDNSVNRSFVERALHNTERLNSLLGDLIEISRIESGEMKMSFRYFSVNEFLEQVVREMSPAAAQKNIRLTLDSKSGTAEAFGDKGRLKQVMFNLVDNAIKYTQGGGSITVSCTGTEGGIRISVEDTGAGIAEEHIPRIFERFYRVDKERSREAGGTGLGLAIVKHIIEAHDSRVEIRSEVGRGSTFSFLLKS